jgi:hypothetical protein
MLLQTDPNTELKETFVTILGLSNWIQTHLFPRTFNCADRSNVSIVDIQLSPLLGLSLTTFSLNGLFDPGNNPCPSNISITVGQGVVYDANDNYAVPTGWRVELIGLALQRGQTYSFNSVDAVSHLALRNASCNYRCSYSTHPY